MMPKIKPPCIRNLSRFSDGCPKMAWDGEEGCTAWVEISYKADDPSNPDIIVKACIDLVTFDVRFKTLKLLEGNQIATETLRNGLCENVNGKVEPKPDPAISHLLHLMTQGHNKLLIP